jgi:glycine/sarcosine N-methyltransferase
MPSVEEFYDGLADDYDLVWGGSWEAVMHEQGAVLDRIIRDWCESAADVLDCACGIGTQALGLAQRGYRVHGTDLSAGAVARAKREAHRLGLSVSFGVSDFRVLDEVTDHYDVIVCCDNALPHLLDDSEVQIALEAMRAKTRPRGLLIVSTRDYDRALVERPVTAPPLLVPGSPRKLLVRLHDWDSPDSNLYTVRLLVLSEQLNGWQVAEHAARYRAITRDRLAELARAAGWASVQWLEPQTSGFFQPLLVGTSPD